jgi:uncharacterized protein YjlB
MLPVLIYKKVWKLPRQKNKSAEIIQQHFLSHYWSNSWKNGIYNYHHYHSNTHECIGVAMGSAILILGGPGEKRITIKQGDLLIIPAGVGHKCVSHSTDFLCVGAYPKGKAYDINTGTIEEYKKALPMLKKIPIPTTDPVFGKGGFLFSYWK